MNSGSVGSKLIRERHFAVTVKTAALAGRLEEKYFHFPVFRLITRVLPANDELVSPRRRSRRAAARIRPCGRSR